MVSTTIRLRPDQRAFIDQVVEDKAIDLSEFVRLCVDASAPVVAKTLKDKVQIIPHNGNARLVSLKTLKAARANGKKGKSIKFTT